MLLLVMALRSLTDHIRDAEIADLQRCMTIVLNELFSRDESIRLASLRSFGSLGSSGGLGERERAERIRMCAYVLLQIPALGWETEKHHSFCGSVFQTKLIILTEST